MRKYNIDSFGWPNNKLKSAPPRLLFNKEIIFIPKILKRKISYCIDSSRGKTLDGWYIDQTLANFTFKNIVRIKNISLSMTLFDKFMVKLSKMIKFKKIKIKKDEVVLFGPYSDAYAHQLHEFIIRLFYINNINLKKRRFY